MSLKKILAALTLAALLAACGTCAFAEEGLEMLTPYESIRKDSFTGQLLEGSEVGETVSTPANGSYREGAGYLFQLMQEDGTVTSSVPDRMVTQDAVSLQVPIGAGIKVYRNGEEVSREEWPTLSQPGQYLVSEVGAQGDQRLLGFAIIGRYAGDLYSYTLPEGFAITALVINDSSQPAGGTSADLSQEGSYSIRYRNKATGVEYDLNLVVDHTPPRLELQGLNENNYAAGPVSVSVAEEGCTANVLLNDKPYPYRETFTQPGYYTLQVWDKAGNSTSCAFTIRMYLDLSAGVFMALVAIGLVVLAGSLTYRRKNRRVR